MLLETLDDIALGNVQKTLVGSDLKGQKAMLLASRGEVIESPDIIFQGMSRIDHHRCFN